MTVADPIPLEQRRATRQPHRLRPARPRIVVEKGAVVNAWLDANTLATEATFAAGHALRTAEYGLPPGPERDAMRTALCDAIDRLKKVVEHARVAADRYESQRPLSD